MTVYFGNIKEPILKMPHELRKAILKPTLFPRSLLNVRLCSKEKYTGIKHTEGCSLQKVVVLLSTFNSLVPAVEKTL